MSELAAHFIGSHPLAGSEKAGVAWATADLFCRGANGAAPLVPAQPAETALALTGAGKVGKPAAISAGGDAPSLSASAAIQANRMRVPFEASA